MATQSPASLGKSLGFWGLVAGLAGLLGPIALAIVRSAADNQIRLGRPPLAIVGLLNSIFSIWFLLTLPVGVLAIILGVVAYRGDRPHRGMAITGIVLGILGLFLFIGTF